MKFTRGPVVLACALATSIVALMPSSSFADANSDKQFLSTAAQSDVNEIKLSQLAETKASDPRIKAFAHKMVADHNRLEASMKPWVDSWKLTPPSGLDSDHQAVYDKLNGLSGSDFDKAYMSAMAEDHHKALDAFTQEVDTSNNPKFKAAVVKGKAVVAAHTSMADSLNAKL
jgi:putative membrane protein